jgi:glyceraldehyde-3-phosphate dehydrogenase/erythrose-4-phosphate dehydrogenase
VRTLGRAAALAAVTLLAATDAGNLVGDTQVREEAAAAANDVVRNASDCDAVKAALPETRRKLDEAAKRVRTDTGRVSLDSLNKQVANVSGACP